MHSKAVYGRLVADVFVDGRNVEEMLRAEGYAKLGLADGEWSAGDSAG
jgi:endonuclease YncB( thermonuclease family)